VGKSNWSFESPDMYIFFQNQYILHFSTKLKQELTDLIMVFQDNISRHHHHGFNSFFPESITLKPAYAVTSIKQSPVSPFSYTVIEDFISN
jgi:hypothetical protein